MDSTRFDELTKALATSTSRRQALRRLGGILGGTALAGLFPGLAFASNSACAHFCNAVFGADTPAAKQCTSDAAHGKGLCSSCGSVAPSSICCTRNSSGLCSSYIGAACCGSSATCLGGSCCATANVCGSTCLAAPCDASQCLTCDTSTGACVSTCPTGQTCRSGVCVSLTQCGDTTCPPSDTFCCGDTCCGAPNSFCCTDHCCGANGSICCNNVCCPAGSVCCGDTCCPSGSHCNGNSCAA